MSTRYRIPSPQTVRVLACLLGQMEAYGYELMKLTGLGPGTLYGLLKRLSDDGHVQRASYLVAGRERIAYQLTVRGKQFAERALLEHEVEQGIRMEVQDA